MFEDYFPCFQRDGLPFYTYFSCKIQFMPYWSIKIVHVRPNSKRQLILWFCLSQSVKHFPQCIVNLLSPLMDKPILWIRIIGMTYNRVDILTDNGEIICVGWAKMVRTIADTIIYEDLGTWLKILRITGTRHRCQADPTNTVSMVARSPSCASLMARLTLRSPLATRLRKTPTKTRHPRSFPNQNPKLPVHRYFWRQSRSQTP